MQEPKLLSLKEFCEKYPKLVSMATIRSWVRKSNQNNFDCCIHRIGHKIFIDVEKFFEWTRLKK